MPDISTDVTVLGAGPGGYVAAICCARLGLTTTLIEAGHVGGTCLNVGCIPSKALIHIADLVGPEPATRSSELPARSAIVDGLRNGVTRLLTEAGVRHIQGRGTLLDGKTVEVTTASGITQVRSRHLVLATGSRSVELEQFPIGGRIISSTEALALDMPPDNLAVIGAGYIGIELGTAFAKLGSKVTVVEAGRRILPIYDEQLTRPVERRLRSLDVETITGVVATAMHPTGICITTGEGVEHVIPADKILVTVGRVPNTDRSGIADLDLDHSGRFVAVDEYCRTSMRNVWAIGDITGEPMLAHRASHQGEAVAKSIAGDLTPFDPRAIPAVVFSDPEIVTAGLSKSSTDDAHTVGTFSWRASGRAATLEASDGLTRVVARTSDHVVVGLQAVGKGAAELAGVFSLALEMCARLEDLSGTVFAHPTLGETIGEAALSALQTPLHS